MTKEDLKALKANDFISVGGTIRRVIGVRGFDIETHQECVWYTAAQKVELTDADKIKYLLAEIEDLIAEKNELESQLNQIL